MPKTGRNDPCPCGSGKKYKQCCLVAARAPEGPDNLIWRRLRRLLDEYNRDMLRFTTNVYGPGAIDEAWREFLLDEAVEFDPESVHIQVFMPWLYHFWSPDSAETAVRDAALHDVIPTAEYLRRKKSLNPLLREYLESCLAAPLSVLEVLRTDPSRGLRLHDTFTGEAHEVMESGASKVMHEGDLVFGQVAKAGGIAMLEICQAFVIPPIWKIEVMNLRQRLLQGAATMGPERLRDYDIEILDLYHEIAKRILEPKLPALQNTDGEPLSPRRVVFEIPSAQEAFDALKHLALDDTEDELLCDAVRDTEGGLRRVTLPWLKHGNAQNPSWNNTVLGSIEIDGTRLAAEVDSERREQTIRDIVAQALGKRARHRATEIQSMEQLLSHASAAPGNAKDDAALAELPEVKARIAEMMAQHYEHWVNEKLPALGGRSPLEAAADPAKREAVEALVRQIERDGERMAPPLDPAIVRGLRERLRLG
jgi:hypothetical protein